MYLLCNGTTPRTAIKVCLKLWLVWRHSHRRRHTRHARWYKARWRWWKCPLGVIHLHIGRRRRRGHPHWHTHLHRHARREDRLLRIESWGRWGLCKGPSKLTLIRALKTWHRWPGTESYRRWRRSRCHRQCIIFSSLCSKKTFCRGSVTFALPVLFEGILNADSFVHEELAVHRLDSRV